MKRSAGEFDIACHLRDAGLREGTTYVEHELRIGRELLGCGLRPKKVIKPGSVRDVTAKGQPATTHFAPAATR